MKHKILAVIVAGISGTLANAAAAGLLLDTSKFNLALVPGRYAVAILCVSFVPIVYSWFSGVMSHVVALSLLTLAPSLIAKFLLGAGAPWSWVLALNGVFALSAWISYRWVLDQETENGHPES